MPGSLFLAGIYYPLATEQFRANSADSHSYHSSGLNISHQSAKACCISSISSGVEELGLQRNEKGPLMNLNPNPCLKTTAVKMGSTGNVRSVVSREVLVKSGGNTNP